MERDDEEGKRRSQGAKITKFPGETQQTRNPNIGYKTQISPGKRIQHQHTETAQQSPESPGKR
eukprot:5807597-Pyramimonas_sp.AAC.1